MDGACYDALSSLNLPNVHLIALEDFEKGDEELLKAKQNRTLIEYYFTCTPSLPLFILNCYPGVDVITYLDADLFFFADPTPIYQEIADHSIAIIGHRFPPHLRNLECYGIYNVGWLSFRRDEHALTCLRWWRERCIEWCYDRCEDGRFADQKYLDDWPNRFRNVVVLRHKGANLAPWNLSNYTIREEWDGVRVDGEPLIFFHFHGFRQVRSWLYDPGLARYQVRVSKVMVRGIIAPYIRILLEVSKQLPFLAGGASLPGGIRESVMQWLGHSSLPRCALGRVRELSRIGKGWLARQYIVVVNERIIAI